jgi:hypothetical protein
VTIRRLNQPEYNNTVRDLLDDNTKPALDFPADDFGHGFSNIADVLSTAPVLIEKYDNAARALVDTAIAREAAPGQSSRFEAENASTSTGAAQGGFWNLFTNGTISAQVTFASTGRYTFRVRAYQSRAGSEDAKMVLRVDGRDVNTFDVPALQAAPGMYTIEADVTQGSKRVEVAFINDFYMDPNDRNLFVDWVEVQRPSTVVAPDRAKIMVCDVNAQGASCARTIVTRFGRKAWRRPLTTAEVDRYSAIFSSAIAEMQPPLEALSLSLEAMLLSPHFLYRVELDPEPTSLTPHKLNDFELAARLSYFLWGSMPDEQLNAVADRGALETELSAQVTRMLADSKAQMLVTQFGGQWLRSNSVEETAPSASVFPNVTAATKRSMREQTEAVFGHFLRSDDSAKGLLGSDFTYLNDTLASHYGLPAPGSATMQRVQLTSNRERGSLLGHAGILTVTSPPTRTSPVKRGAWVLGNLLCAEPAPPPPGVEGLPAEAMPTGTLRQQVERHRADPNCAGCHALMDPLGFGLEPLDGVGRNRTTDTGGFAIDATGVMPDGRAFNGPAEMTAMLKEDPAFTHCITEKLFTYGLGRAPTREELCQVEGITQGFQSSGYKLKGLIQALAQSRSFTHRRGETQ